MSGGGQGRVRGEDAPARRGRSTGARRRRAPADTRSTVMLSSCGRERERGCGREAGRRGGCGGEAGRRVWARARNRRARRRIKCNQEQSRAIRAHVVGEHDGEDSRCENEGDAVPAWNSCDRHGARSGSGRKRRPWREAARGAWRAHPSRSPTVGSSQKTANEAMTKVMVGTITARTK